MVLVLVLVLDFGTAERVGVRVPPKAEYEYEKSWFLARNRIERQSWMRRDAKLAVGVVNVDAASFVLFTLQ